MKRGLLIAVLLSVFAFCGLSFAEGHYAKAADTMSSTGTTSTDGSSD